MKRFVILIVLLFMLTGAGMIAAQDAPLNVVATTTIIADVAHNVGGELVSVTAIVPYNTDIHAFQASPADAARIAEADVILVSGVGLETFLSGLEENVAMVEPVVVSNGIEMLSFAEEHEAEAEPTEETLGILGVDMECGEDQAHEETEAHEHGACDPHVWTNPANVIVWTNNIAQAFAAVDPDHADTYRANAGAYITQLEELDAEIEEILSAIPEDKRILVTNHEFLGYFAHHYEFEVVGTVIPSGSTSVEPDPQQVAALIEIVNTEGVPAIFAEISADNRLAQTIAQEAGVTVVSTLYSDSLGGPDTPADTYINYLRYNAQTVANALHG